MNSPSPEPQDASEIAEAAAPDDAQGLEAEATAEALGDEWLKDLPQEVVSWMVRSLHTRELWDWLGDPARGNLRLVTMSGFRAVPANLKQLAVSKKLVKHAQTHAEILRGLVDLWRSGRAPLFDAVQERDDDALLEILPALLHTHGGEALLLALAALERHKALDALAALGTDSDPPDSQPIPDAPPQPGTQAQGEDHENSAAPVAPAPSEESARAQALLGEARERESKLQAGLSASVARAEAERAKATLKAREAERAFKALQHKATSLEKEHAESKRLLDRSERRGRNAERARDELEADNKKLRRQMRRQQEISEEIRKQLASAASQLEALRPSVPGAPSSAASTYSASNTAQKPKTAANGAAGASGAAPGAGRAASSSRLEREYVLSADGRQVRVTPRQVKQRVDANDEEWVFRLIQALEAVAQVDSAGHRTFLDALKPLGFYYSRVLTTDTLRVLVDASNVVRFESDHLGKGRLKYLLSMREELRRRDCFPIKLIADASLPYFIDEAEEFNAMARRGEVEMSMPGQEADELLAREARRTGAYVVTNDRLFFQKATPDFEPPRITFRVIGGYLIVDEF